MLTSFGSRLGGGVFEAVVAHAALLRSQGWSPIVIAIRDGHSEVDCARFGDTPVILVDRKGPASVCYAPDLVGALNALDIDLLHLHGIWQYPSHAGAVWAKRSGRPYVISAHGMLDPWITGRGKLKKFIAGMLYERRSWRNAAMFHALTGDESKDVQVNAGSVRTAIIPNAVPTGEGARSEAGFEHVFISRIHPKKNLDALLEGWVQATQANPDIQGRLTIAGWGEPEHVAQFEHRLASLQCDTVQFIGPIYAEAKLQLLRNARFICLPSFSEGLPMTMLEAWAEGTPTLMSQACHLGEAFAANAAIDCGTSAASVASAFTTSLTMSNENWAAMSHAASRLAEEKFAPQVIAGAWNSLYSGLIADKRDHLQEDAA